MFPHLPANIEAPLLVIFFGVILAIAAPAVANCYSYKNEQQAFDRVLDVSQMLITAGIAGALLPVVGSKKNLPK